MNEIELFNQIKEFTTSVSEDTISTVEVEERLNDIHVQFQRITDITGFDNKVEYLAAIPAAKGKALGLNHAAQCLLDYKRTVRFVKAIVLAIRHQQSECPGKLINLFYAGCGPYATLLALVAPYFKPNEVKFTLLEINKNAVESAKKLIDALELNDYVKEVFVADAVTFKIPKPEEYQIVISETLDALLFRECYVPIVFNLLPQFNDEVILIPENVIITSSLSSTATGDKGTEIVELGHVVNVREAEILNRKSAFVANLQEVSIDLKTIQLNNYETILLDTHVHVYDSIWLERNESSLTFPYQIQLEKPITFSSIIFTYQLEPEIELKCSFV